MMESPPMFPKFGELVEMSFSSTVYFQLISSSHYYTPGWIILDI